MTMRNPLDGEVETKKPELDPKKLYSFTWPGQPAKTIRGAELAEILKGANPDMLDIKEAGDAASPEPAPEAVSVEAADVALTPVPPADVEISASDRETSPALDVAPRRRPR